MTRRQRSWWGTSWLEALEGRAGVDPDRLARGRQYARDGAVRSLSVGPGEVSATVQGSRLQPYTVSVRVPVIADESWERLLDVLSAQASHTAALLDGELPTALVADLAAAGFELLPGAGELRTACTCPDEVEPCKHSAAVCLLVADRLDRDPFELLALRGRSRADVLAGVASRRGAPADAAPEQPEADTMSAAEAYARVPGPLPPAPRPPARPGRPAPLPVESPSGAVRPGELQALAADTAARAWELLTGGGDGGLTLTIEQDVARRATTLLGTRALDALAKRAGLAPAVLGRRAIAWQHGGSGALAVLDDQWSPDYLDLAEGVAALGTGGHVSANRVSDSADVRQLRLGRDGLWYPMRRVRGAWEVSGPPAADPKDLV